MKTVKVTTNNIISVIDIDFSDLHSVQNAIGGGYIETVHTQRMFDYFGRPIILIVDEEGILKDLPVNAFGSDMYGYLMHGNPICGDLILAVPDGEFLRGLEDAESVKDKMIRDFEYLKEKSKNE